MNIHLTGEFRPGLDLRINRGYRALGPMPPRLARHRAPLDGKGGISPIRAQTKEMHK
jgi:hypothetical protein